VEDTAECHTLLQNWRIQCHELQILTSPERNEYIASDSEWLFNQTALLTKSTMFCNSISPVQLRLTSLSILTAISRWTWVSRCWLKQKMMEVVVTTGAISCAKLQSNHHHQQTNIQFFLQAGCPSCRPTNSVKALKRKISHSMDLLTPSSPGGLPTLSLTTNSSWLLWGGLPCLSSALWSQYPKLRLT